MAKVHLGFRKIILRRLLCIILWHVSIQTLVLQFIASVDLAKEPLLWTTTLLKNLMKPRFFIIALVQLFLSSVFITIESIHYLKADPCGNITRFRYICQKLSRNNLVWFFVYIFRGILSTVAFYVAFKHHFLSSSVESNVKNDDNRDTETLIILLNNSMWINFLFFMYDFVYQKSFKYFSIVQSHQCVIMPTIIVAAKNVSVRSFYYCGIFFVFYLIKGHSICAFTCYLFSFKCSITYTTIFSPFILYRLWLLNAFILFNNLILKILFDVFLTSKIDFCIDVDSNDKQDMFTLKNALATNNVPLLQYLGYFDLNIVSQFDTARRKQIFSLSYPGGHPHIWREISQEVIQLIYQTNDNLVTITSPKLTSDENISKYDSADIYYSKMRPLSSRPFVYEKCSPVEPFEENILQKISNFLKTVRPISYFIEEMTEKQLESALQHYQALSLGCYSLANLAAASKIEDKFGMVQQDLPSIISALLKLYITLNKLVIVVHKKPNSSIQQVKKYLTNVVKSSLYKLAIDFGPYIKDLSLCVEDEKLFNSFIHFKN